MNSVVSATTGAVHGEAARVSRRDRFLDAAHGLLAQAHGEFGRGEFDLALESAYRAALRVAGAVNAESPVIQRRKRLPTSAWDRLALTSQQGEAWAGRFARFSRLRGRVASGIETRPSPLVVAELLDLAAQFLDEAVPGANVQGMVA
ncbi:SAV_6107 family HEPN domain-containing protein [Corynebacterium liangguodongii]|uniref:Uncharacterized protein n=1 Tax=Corynebacterium liangguodongii TaxID=2079535 RepID=A0A2S0WF06_9CORY|nr:SAV_6107 family HEPN domain-containing protein [Corynebacterium liangguodongii]AWB84363.1 hypothetical protein C3E79_07600 [Corynebacterium liangguodongii]PWB99853.1 hypothetical protein DF219_04195 [Corynebacterium liangguodongii]